VLYIVNESPKVGSCIGEAKWHDKKAIAGHKICLPFLSLCNANLVIGSPNIKVLYGTEAQNKSLFPLLLENSGLGRI